MGVLYLIQNSRKTGWCGNCGSWTSSLEWIKKISQKLCALVQSQSAFSEQCTKSTDLSSIALPNYICCWFPIISHLRSHFPPVFRFLSVSPSTCWRTSLLTPLPPWTVAVTVAIVAESGGSNHVHPALPISARATSEANIAQWRNRNVPPQMIS